MFSSTYQSVLSISVTSLNLAFHRTHIVKHCHHQSNTSDSLVSPQRPATKHHRLDASDLDLLEMQPVTEEECSEVGKKVHKLLAGQGLSPAEWDGVVEQCGICNLYFRGDYLEAHARVEYNLV